MTEGRDKLGGRKIVSEAVELKIFEARVAEQA
jgi:hypothetical protein